eukprot:TRINITY_DN78_c0_g3_i3.p1 TRINITY_DN78_c0_g3~~TRINITY_DN78_c0_g3_i3.p1  ORF type:complete len:399 (+),score=71.54 TRINITY_DN78_c0_g3_i3:636-1832(+)
MAAFINEAKAKASPTCKYLLVVDEVQMLYGEPTRPLWIAVKFMQQCCRNQQSTLDFSAILFGTHGVGVLPAATPLTFDPLNSLNLQFSPPRLGQDTALALARFTGHHVGLTRTVLEVLRDEFKSKPEASQGEIIATILGERVADAIASTRCFIRFEMMQDAQASASKRLIEQVLRVSTLRASQQFPMPDSNAPDSGTVWFLVSRGVFAVDHSRKHFYFSSPALARCYYSRFFCTSRALTMPADIDALLKQTLTKIPVYELKNSLGCNVDTELSERTWQMQFFSKLTESLPAKCCVSPDVGALFGTSGKLDFYINGTTRWALELLINGKGIKEHFERFSQLYSAIPRKDFRLVDLRCVTRPPKKRFPHQVVHVLYTEDLKEFFWQHGDGRSRVGPYKFA